MSSNELREKVFMVVRDQDREFVTEPMVDMWLADALADLGARLQLFRKEAAGTTSGNRITLPAGHLETLSLRLGTTDVEFTDPDTWNHYSDTGTTPGNTLGRIFDGGIEIYPTPSEGTAYRLRFVKVPGTYTDLPVTLQRKMVNYAIGHAMLHQNNAGLADRYLAMYEDGLPSPSTGKEALWPGPLSVTRDLGYWDSVGQHIG